MLIQEITDFFLRTLTQSNVYEPPMSPPSSNVTYTVPVVQSSSTAASDDHIQHNAAMTNSSTTTGTAAANSATTANSATAGTTSRVGDAAMLQQPATAATAAYATDTFTEVPLKAQEQTGVQSVELEVASHSIVPPAVRYFVHQAEEWHACDSFAAMPSQRRDVTVTLAPAGVLTVSTSSTATAAAAQVESCNSNEQQQHSATDTTTKSHGADSSSGATSATATSLESVQSVNNGQSSAGAAPDQHAIAAADTAVDTTAIGADRDITATDNSTRNSTATATAAVSDVHLNGVQSTAVNSDNAASAVAAVRGYDELLVNVLKDRDGAGNSRWAAMTKASHDFYMKY
jgi:hypothetical protein